MGPHFTTGEARTQLGPDSAGDFRVNKGMRPNVKDLQDGIEQERLLNSKAPVIARNSMRKQDPYGIIRTRRRVCK